MAEDAFAKLQYEITTRNIAKKGVVTGAPVPAENYTMTKVDLQNALLFRPASSETFSSFRLGLIAKKINPDDLLTVASIMSLQYDKIFLRYAGLALRYNANPNTHVMAKFFLTGVPREDPDTGDIITEVTEAEIPVLLGKHLWDLTPRSSQESVDRDVEVFGDYGDVDAASTSNISQTVITTEGNVDITQVVDENGVDEISDEDQIIVPVDSGVWMFDPPLNYDDIEKRYRDKQKTSLDLFCMMTLKGLDLDMLITDTKLLMQMGIDATKFAMDNPQFFSTLYSQIAIDSSPLSDANDNTISFDTPGANVSANPEAESYLGSLFIDEIDYFCKYKNSLQNVYGVNELRKQRILDYAFYLDLESVLTLTDVYGVKENLQFMFMFQDTQSLRGLDPETKRLKGVLIRLQAAKMISRSNSSKKGVHSDNYDMGVVHAQPTILQKHLELTLWDWAIAYYSQVGIDTLLEIGIIPDYSVRSNTIRASKAAFTVYPALSQILNKSIVDYVKYGYGLDTDQLRELSFSPSTQAAIAKEYTVPSWIHMCRVKNDVTANDIINSDGTINNGDKFTINPELKELARQVGIPLGSTEEQICSTFKEMTKQDPTKIKEAIYKVNRERIEVMITNPTDLITHKNNHPYIHDNDNKNKPSVKILKEVRVLDKNAVATDPPVAAEITVVDRPLCSNFEALTRPIEDYSDIDRVTYADGNDTWCFVSDQFPDLLKTGTNPWKKAANGIDNTPIPLEIISNMRQKLELLKSEGLDQKSASVSEGVDNLFSKKSDKTQVIYDRMSDRRLMQFLQFINPYLVGYDVPLDIFDTLTSSDYQLLSDSVLSEDTHIYVDPLNWKLALRDFADAVLIDINNFSVPDDVGNNIADILSNIEVEVTETTNVEEIQVDENGNPIEITQTIQEVTVQ